MREPLLAGNTTNSFIQIIKHVYAINQRSRQQFYDDHPVKINQKSNMATVFDLLIDLSMDA